MGRTCKEHTNKESQMGEKKHAKHMKGQTGMLSNQRGCPRRTNVGLDWVSIVPLDWSMDDTQTHAWTCRQACKDAKVAKKTKRVAQSKQGKHINITEVYLTSGYIQTSPRRDRCNHTSKWPQGLTSTSPWRAQSVAKPRYREANIDIEHRSKQANIDK